MLSLRELNRATLARQLLLERASLGTLDGIRHLVALQGQVSKAPYYGLWARLQAFQRNDLTCLLEERQVVRASSLRITLHILTAEDYLLFQPVLQRLLSATLHSFISKTPGFEMEKFVEEIRAYLRSQPRTGSEIRAKMESMYPGMGKPQIGDGLRMYLALVHIPPAGTWDFTGQPASVEATEWLRRSLPSPQEGERALILRYLAASGPASVKDMQSWSRLTGLQHVVDELRPQLRVLRDEEGRELFDLLDAPLPSGDTPAPVRFLPEYDNAILGYAERKRILPDEYRAAVMVFNGMRPTFLLDGFVAGAWKIKQGTETVTLQLEPFRFLSKQEHQELLEEGQRLVDWIVEDRQQGEVVFV